MEEEQYDISMWGETHMIQSSLSLQLYYIII